MTVTRSRIEVNIPRKRKGVTDQHDKVRTICENKGPTNLSEHSHKEGGRDSLSLAHTHAHTHTHTHTRTLRVTHTHLMYSLLHRD